MLGSLYVDAFICFDCHAVWFVEARTYIDEWKCFNCGEIIRSDDPESRKIIRDLEFWQK